MNKIQRLVLVVVVVGLNIQLKAQKYSNEFLSIGVGARAQAMGSSVVASSSDAFSIFWNPAGLVDIENNGLQLGIMHAEWFAGIGKHYVFSFSLPMQNKNSRLGFGFVRFGIDGIPNTLSLYNDDGSINYDNIVEFSASDMAFFGGFGSKKELTNGYLNYGSSVKIVRRVIGSFANSWGFGLDLGAQYHRNNWKMGILLKDISTTVNTWSINFTDQEKVVLLDSGNELPGIRSNEITKPSINIGLGRTIEFETFSIYPEIGFSITSDGQRNTLISGDPFSLDAQIGLELLYKDFLFIRLGANQFQRSTDFDGTESIILKPGIGTGFLINAIELDYSFTNLVTDNALYSHIISIKINLKEKKDK
jgi:hypothetical protein